MLEYERRRTEATLFGEFLADICPKFSANKTSPLTSFGGIV